MEKAVSVFKDAIKNICSSKLRSILTALGLVIGIASVILLVGIGNGASSNVTSAVQSLGTGNLTISIDSESETLVEYNQLEDFLKINNVEKVAPYKTVSGTVSKETISSRGTTILATTPSYFDIMNIGITDGRILSNIDLNNTNKVCLIGSSLASNLFEGKKNKDIVGKYINIDGDKYTIVGVLTKIGSSMGNNVDSTVIIPFTTAKYLKSDTSINTLYVKVTDEEYINKTILQIEKYLKSNLNIESDYFSVVSQESMVDTASDINSTLSLLLGGIAGISLVVGGIGVMNVMLVSVTERTKEIGIRKALGAKRKNILIQFLIESLILCILGGSLGIILGLGVGFVLQTFGFNFVINSYLILISFGSSAFIGLVFGIFPAYKASKLNPIDALRTE